MKEYKFKINGNQYDVMINSVEGSTANVTVNGLSYTVEMENSVAAAPAPAPTAAAAPAAAPAPAPSAAPAAAGSKSVTSPLPGVIVDVCVKEGQAVKAGQKVAVLEAMKMENDIESTVDGTVASINVAKGDSVLEGAVIVTLA